MARRGCRTTVSIDDHIDRVPDYWINAIASVVSSIPVCAWSGYWASLARHTGSLAAILCGAPLRLTSICCADPPSRADVVSWPHRCHLVKLAPSREGDPGALGAVPAACTLGLVILAGGQSEEANAPDLALAMCQTSGPIRDLDPVQARNARVIVAATQLTVANSGGDQSAQTQAELIALMTADAESSLHNYANPKVPASEQLPNDGDPPTGGDHDSVGLFQQRDSWGRCPDA
jgi:hypothetical protein